MAVLSISAEEGVRMRKTVIFKKKSQVTIPKEMADKLGLEEGSTLEARLEDGKIVLIPLLTVPADQAWFWTKEWQIGEREAEEDIQSGRVKSFTNTDELFTWLDSNNKE